MSTALPRLHFDLDRAKLLVGQYMALREQESANANDGLGDALESVRPLVRLIAPRYTPEHAYEDVEQDILMHLASVLPRYNRNERELNAWLVKIIRNKAISLWRQRSTEADTVSIENYPHLENEEELEEEPIEYSVSEYSTLIYAWIKVRFPSIPPSRMKKAAEILATYLLDNRPIKHIKAALIGLLGDELRVSQISTLYDSVNVFLRAMAFDPAYVVRRVASSEFSLIPELKLVLGDRQTRVLYTIFRGTYVRFRSKN